MKSPPRLPLARLPTPVFLAHRLSEKYGVSLWFKDEAATGFGFGGNKIRSLEYILGDIKKFDRVIFTGGTKSNFVRAGVIAALSKGLQVECVFFGNRPPVLGGNYGLIRGLNVTETFTGDPQRESAERLGRDLFEKYQRLNQRVLLVPRGGALPEGALGFYISLQDEIEMQTREICQFHSVKHIDHLILAIGTGTTLAGLKLGQDRLRSILKIWGFCASRPLAESSEMVDRLARECSSKFELNVGFKDCIEIRDETLGDGYGQLTANELRAIQLALATEGVSLDPVFNCKAFLGFEKLVESGRIQKGEVVLFLNGGGIPEVFKN